MFSISKASFESEIKQTKCCNSGKSCAKPPQVETKKCCNSGKCNSQQKQVSQNSQILKKPVTSNTKKPKMGIEACCGRGCNGCLIFWYDLKFKKQRQLIKTKKLGEILSKAQSKSEREIGK